MHELVYTTRLAGQTVAASAAADARPLLDRLLGRSTPAAVDGTGRRRCSRLAGRAHLTRRSVWFQNSVRGALGLAIAVLIAEITEVAHGFWVVLGAMSVLRTTALTTGSTALRALGGTVVGFVGRRRRSCCWSAPRAWHLWLLLPVTVLIAGYLPEAVSFVAGQAAFTVMVVVLFNIIPPIGWNVGLVRVEDIAVRLRVGADLRRAALAARRGRADPAARWPSYYRRSADAVVAAVDRCRRHAARRREHRRTRRCPRRPRPPCGSTTRCASTCSNAARGTCRWRR